MLDADHSISLCDHANMANVEEIAIGFGDDLTCWNVWKLIGLLRGYSSLLTFSQDEKCSRDVFERTQKAKSEELIAKQVEKSRDKPVEEDTLDTLLKSLLTDRQSHERKEKDKDTTTVKEKEKKTVWKPAKVSRRKRRLLQQTREVWENDSPMMDQSKSSYFHDQPKTTSTIDEDTLDILFASASESVEQAKSVLVGTKEDSPSSDDGPSFLAGFDSIGFSSAFDNWNTKFGSGSDSDSVSVGEGGDSTLSGGILIKKIKKHKKSKKKGKSKKNFSLGKWGKEEMEDVDDFSKGLKRKLGAIGPRPPSLPLGSRLILGDKKKMKKKKIVKQRRISMPYFISENDENIREIWSSIVELQKNQEMRALVEDLSDVKFIGALYDAFVKVEESEKKYIERRKSENDDELTAEFCSSDPETEMASDLEPCEEDVGVKKSADDSEMVTSCKEEKMKKKEKKKRPLLFVIFDIVKYCTTETSTGSASSFASFSPFGRGISGAFGGLFGGFRGSSRFGTAFKFFFSIVLLFSLWWSLVY